MQNIEYDRLWTQPAGTGKANSQAIGFIDTVPKSATSEPTARAPSSQTDTRRSDPRSLRSQERLRDALLALVTTNSFERITLREIAAAAGVSYPTFFNNYDSKDALFQDIARKEIIDFLVSGFRHDISSANWRPGEGICGYISQRRSLWSTLLTAGASEAMRSEFIRQGREIPRSEPGFDSNFPIDVVSGVIASGVFEIIAWWLAQDAHYPVATIADMLETLVIEPALNLPRGFFSDRKGVPCDV